MSGTRYATVHYRKLDRDGAVLDDGTTLSSAIHDALDEQHPEGGRYRDNWLHRLMPSFEDSDQKRVINNVHTDAQTAFGELCAYTPGDLQALIDANAASGVSAAIAETGAPGGNEYLKGIAYWLVVGDHCYVVQHVAVRTKALEEYLTWFLHDATHIIGSNKKVMLRATFDISAIGGDLDNVRSIEIGGLVPEGVQDRGTSEKSALPLSVREERKTVGEKKAWFLKAKKIVEELYGTVEASKIIKRIPEEAALDVTVNIGYRAVRRGIDTSFMDSLAKGLRNIDDGEVKIRAKNGIIQGDDARLQAHMPFKLVRANGALLDHEDVRLQLREVHDRFLKDGKIS